MGKTDHSGQRKGNNRNVTIFLTLYILFEAYLARCGPCQNMQTWIYFLNLANPIFFKP